MKKNIFVYLLLFIGLHSVFSMGKKDNVIINASLDNIEQVCQKNKFALFYSDDNSNALQVAMRGGNLPVAEWLVENEICDLNHQNIYGRTPVNDAIETSDIEILKLLIQHGARIKQTKYLQDPVVQTVIVGNVDAAEFFATLGIKYNFVMADKKNMLHLAAKFSQKDIVPFLVRNGCKINAPDSENLTPLLISVENDDSDMIAALIENGASIEIKNAIGQTPIFFAVEKFSDSSLQSFIEHKANIEVKDLKNRTPFLFAYELDNFSAATILLKAGASFPKQQLLTALKEQKLSYLPLLLEAGADITVADSVGQNVLHVAASKSDLNSLSQFLEMKISRQIINSKDNKERTPLLLACGTGTGFTGGVKLLLDSGASISETDSGGNLATHVAMMNNSDSASKEIVQVIIDKKASVLNTPNNSGQTLLIIAIKNSKLESSNYLLDLKADVTPKDSAGNTALHYASANDLGEFVRRIVSLGGAINAVNNKNETPLCIAAKNKYESVSEYFLNLNGINIDIKDNSGKSPRTYLWSLYDLRINESRERREKYTEDRKNAWSAAAKYRDEKNDLEKKIRDLESDIRDLDSKINYADKDTDTSSWKNQRMVLNISLAADKIALAITNKQIKDAENEAEECTNKINEEFKISQSYIDRQKRLNSIPRQ